MKTILLRTSFVSLTSLLWAVTAAQGSLYLSSAQLNNVEKFSQTGTDQGSFASTGMSGPNGLAFDSSGNLWVANGNGGVLKYSSSGTYLGILTTLHAGGGWQGIAFDAAGDLYAANSINSKIYKLSPSQLTLGAAVGTETAGTVFATSGLAGPAGLAIDSLGNVFAANQSTETIAKFSSAGTSLGAYTSANFSGVFGLAFDASGRLYATNTGNNKIERFSTTGTDLGVFATTPNVGAFGIAFDGSGDLFAVARFNATTYAQEIDRFSSAGILASVINTPGEFNTFITVQPIPEPAGLGLLIGLGLLGISTGRRARRG